MPSVLYFCHAVETSKARSVFLGVFWSITVMQQLFHQVLRLLEQFLPAHHWRHLPYLSKWPAFQHIMLTRTQSNDDDDDDNEDRAGQTNSLIILSWCLRTFAKKQQQSSLSLTLFTVCVVSFVAKAQGQTPLLKYPDDIMSCVYRFYNITVFVIIAVIIVTPLF